MHAVGRIAYNGWIDNIQASWVKIGLEGHGSCCRGLQRPRRDVDGREHLPRRGCHPRPENDEADFRDLAESVGRHLEQRTTLYGRVVATAG